MQRCEERADGFNVYLYDLYVYHSIQLAAQVLLCLGELGSGLGSKRWMMARLRTICVICYPDCVLFTCFVVLWAFSATYFSFYECSAQS
jgi:hypothetical protein